MGLGMLILSIFVLAVLVICYGWVAGALALLLAAMVFIWILDAWSKDHTIRN